MISVPKGKEEEGVMGKGKFRDRVCGAMKPICDCFSVAAKQAREAEIDVPSKRRFRLMYASGDADSTLPQDTGTGLHEVAARTGIGLRAFLDCLDDVRKRAEQSRTDIQTRLSYRKLPE